MCAELRRIVIVFSRVEVENGGVSFFDRINKINRIGVGVVYIL